MSRLIELESDPCTWSSCSRTASALTWTPSASATAAASRTQPSKRSRHSVFDLIQPIVRPGGARRAGRGVQTHELSPQHRSLAVEHSRRHLRPLEQRGNGLEAGGLDRSVGGELDEQEPAALHDRSRAHALGLDANRRGDHAAAEAAVQDVHVVEAVEEGHQDCAVGDGVTDALERMLQVARLRADEDDSVLIREARHGSHRHLKVAEAYAPHVEPATRDGIGRLLARDDRHGNPGSCERSGEEAADRARAEYCAGGRWAGGGQQRFTDGPRARAQLKPVGSSATPSSV